MLLTKVLLLLLLTGRLLLVCVLVDVFVAIVDVPTLLQLLPFVNGIVSIFGEATFFPVFVLELTAVVTSLGLSLPTRTEEGLSAYGDASRDASDVSSSLRIVSVFFLKQKFKEFKKNFN